MRNQYYISSGEKNAQFTLRVRFEEPTPGGIATRDQYVANLGTNIEYAKTKASQIAGEAVESNGFQLNPYGTDGRAAERAAQAEMRRKRQAAYDAERAAKIRERRDMDAKSQFQGQIGERITRELTTVRWICTGEGMYGNRYVAIFTDPDMNKYVFFGGACASLPNADARECTKIVTFTVIGHNERDGCKQTIIKRPIKAKGA